MKWQIDSKQKLLILDGNYEIDFDRLGETDWFGHLASKNWVESDRIRDELTEIGVVVEDGPEGTKWRISE